eukprot:6937811-Prymnesium_polylepis.1
MLFAARRGSSAGDCKRPRLRVHVCVPRAAYLLVWAPTRLSRIVTVFSGAHMCWACDHMLRVSAPRGDRVVDDRADVGPLL